MKLLLTLIITLTLLGLSSEIYGSEAYKSQSNNETAKFQLESKEKSLKDYLQNNRKKMSRSETATLLTNLITILEKQGKNNEAERYAEWGEKVLELGKVDEPLPNTYKDTNKLVYPPVSFSTNDSSKLSSATSHSATQQNIYSSKSLVRAGGNLWSGVKLYYGSKGMYVGTILGGNDSYRNPYTGAKFRGLKVEMSNGSIEWKDRDAVISGDWYVERDDPAMKRMDWNIFQY